MRRTNWMNVNLRALSRQPTRRARVIEMDVRQQDHGHVADADAGLQQLAAQDGQRARRSGVDEGDVTPIVKDGTRDNACTSFEVKIDEGDACCECLHHGATTPRGASDIKV